MEETGKSRLEQQLAFLMEIDKMKSVSRRTMLTDLSRRETDAEHSWHIALMALLLAEYAGPRVDVNRVIRMALVHDLVEIYAGDTFAYDSQGKETQRSREEAAAGRLFALLPGGQGEELRALWEEFDARETADAQFAAAVDRLQPFLNNCVTGGFTWKEGGVRSPQVYERLQLVRQAMPRVWPAVERRIQACLEKGELEK